MSLTQASEQQGQEWELGPEMGGGGLPGYGWSRQHPHRPGYTQRCAGAAQTEGSLQMVGEGVGPGYQLLAVEIGHRGDIYTTEICKGCSSGFLS